MPKPYTPVGIATWRAVPDTCSNNFATLNPLKKTDMILSEGNLKAESSDLYSNIVSTMGVSSGKYYWETTPLLASGGGNGVGLATLNTDSTTYLGIGLDFAYSGAGTIYGPGDTTTQTGLATFTVGDVIGVAMNLDSSSVTFYKNGTSVSTVSLTSGETYFAAVSDQSGSGDADFVLNFGQNPTFSGNTTAGTFTDSNSKGLFKYEPPSGFLALCEDNLPTPAIKNPGEYFKTVLWTGDGNAGRSITGVGFQPDFVWMKQRNGANSHALIDSVRGPLKGLSSDSTADENNFSHLLSFNSDGFSVGTSAQANESSSYNYVAWCWRAGGNSNTFNIDDVGYDTASAAGLTAGTITPTGASVGTKQGFSIIKYTGNSTAYATLPHGLSEAPKFVIIKNLSNSYGWVVLHTDVGTTGTTLDGSPEYYMLQLNSSAARANFTQDTIWNPTSTTVKIDQSGGANWVNNSNSSYIAYLWAEIPGFSKFGSYVGNASTDGPFVYTGGRPAFVMIKSSTVATNWYIFDSSRQSTNPVTGALFSNTSDIETFSAHDIDFLSNGFKIRQAAGYGANNSGETYVYACFMESPFTTANAK